MSRATVRGWLGYMLTVCEFTLDPRIRRCPRCRLTWETPRVMAAMGGVCHDCFASDL